MLNYWFVWPIGIAVWVIAGFSAFAWFEASELRPNATTDQITLSYFCYVVASKFPLSILIAGLIIGFFTGGLGVHFLWHWDPTCTPHGAG